jgi:hypothetical protein
MYAQRIDLLRKVVAVLFGVFGSVFVFCANVHEPIGVAVFGAATLFCLAAAFGLVLEYLVRWWVETHRNRAGVWQFSLTHLLLLTAALSLVLGVFRILGWGTAALLVVGTIVFTCALELRRSSSPK